MPEAGADVARWILDGGAITGIVLLIEAIGILCALDSVMRARTPQGSIAWALALVFLPIVSVPLYVAFGQRRFDGKVLAHRRGRHALDRRVGEVTRATASLHSLDPALVSLAPLCRVPPTRGNDCELLIDGKATALMQELRAAGIRVKYDDSDHTRPGWKFAEYELKGVPVRLALGARDLENNVVELARRDTREKNTVPMDGLAQQVRVQLDDIQQQMFNRAKEYRDSHITRVDSWEEFQKVLDEKGGFISAHWDGSGETEERIKQETKATIRCIPLDQAEEEGRCILTGKPSRRRVLFAQAY